MMLQLIDKSRIYFYLVLLLTLLSVHNLDSTNYISNFFKVQKITINSDIEEGLNRKISVSLDQFYNFNIFSINPDEIIKILENYNFINEYKIKKEYPSSIKIDLKQTNILAYYFDNNKKTYIGENGKKIKEIFFFNNDLPLIVGKVDILKFLELKKKLIDNGFELTDFVKFYSFKSNRWDLIYKNEIIIKLPITDLDNSLSLLKDLIENSNVNDVKIIDLRVKNRVILL